MRKSELKQLENNVKTEFINAGNELIGKDLRLVEEAVRATVKLLNIPVVMVSVCPICQIEHDGETGWCNNCNDKYTLLRANEP